MANEYRVSQFAVETLRDGAAAGRVSQFAVETLRNGPAAGRVSQFAVEVLRSIATASASGRRRQQTSVIA